MNNIFFFLPVFLCACTMPVISVYPYSANTSASTRTTLPIFSCYNLSTFWDLLDKYFLLLNQLQYVYNRNGREILPIGVVIIKHKLRVLVTISFCHSYRYGFSGRLYNNVKTLYATTLTYVRIIIINTNFQELG